MSNPANLRVYYDEDIDSLDEDDITEQLENEISGINGVTEVNVENVFTSRPYEAVVEVYFDEVDISSSELEQEVSSFSFLHNASA